MPDGYDQNILLEHPHGGSNQYAVIKLFYIVLFIVWKLGIA